MGTALGVQERHLWRRRQSQKAAEGEEEKEEDVDKTTDVAATPTADEEGADQTERSASTSTQGPKEGW